MSLIGEFPLAAVSLPSKDIEASKRFYKDVIGLKPIEVEEDSKKSLHFDLGNIRLSLTLVSASKSEKSAGAPLSGQLVFIVESSLEKVYEDLAKRGVKFKSKKILGRLFRQVDCICRSRWKCSNFVAASSEGHEKLQRCRWNCQTLRARF